MSRSPLRDPALLGGLPRLVAAIWVTAICGWLCARIALGSQSPVQEVLAWCALATHALWLFAAIARAVPRLGGAMSSRAWDLLTIVLMALAITGPASNALGAIPGFVLLARETGRARRPVSFSLSLLALNLVATLIGALLTPISLGGLLSVLLAPIVSFLLGLLRRQSTVAQEAQEAARLAVERERLSEQRNALARDLHDVLAHSLGGLTIQLDAVEAELEAGKTQAAAARVSRARALAGEGLPEARRAVAALREPAAPAAAEPAAAASPVTSTPTHEDLPARLGALVADHRELGGSASLHVAAPEPPAPLADALAAVVRECLSNARRHAAGQSSEIRLDADPRGWTLTVSTPVAGPSAARDTGGGSTGGGFGLMGIRERAELLGGTMTVVSADPFAVTVRLPRPPEGADQANSANARGGES